MIRADATARQAWVELQALVPRWHAILDAHGGLLGLDRESHDYTPVRNVDAVYPNRRATMGRVAAPPWPAESMARLLWYVTTNDVELWLPTLDEEREEFEAVEAARPRMQRVFAVSGVPQAPQCGDLTTRPRGSAGTSRIVLPSE